MEEFFVSYLGEGVYSVLKALFVLIIAFVAAKIAKALVVKILEKIKVSYFEEKADGEKERIIEFIGKLVYLLVFLLFVPGIFETLGMTGVSAPLLGLLSVMWGYVPNILSAIIVLWAGFFIAGIVRDILIPVFDKIKLNKIQEKFGMEVSEQGKLSKTLAYIVYVLIVIPICVAALTVLNIEAISAPAVAMLATVFAYIPNLVAALIIIVIGCIIAKFAGNIVENLIASTGLDAKLNAQLEGKNGKFVLSKVVGTAVNVAAVIFFVVEGANALNLKVVSNIGNAVIGYMPLAVASALIVAVCYILSTIAEKALKNQNHELGAVIAKAAIYTVGGFMVLNELGVAPAIVNTAFVIIVAALAVAFAVSFGIGGKDFAGRTLEKIEAKFNKDEK